MTSFFVQNYQVYKIKYADAGKDPVIYTLVDLMDAPIAGHYYEPQLTKCSAPEPSEFFKMESVLDERMVGNRKQYFVKYLHYPAKFNRWVWESDLLK